MTREQIKTCADIVRESISAVDYAGLIGIQVNRKGFCRCPFHDDHDASMKLYPGNRGFHCFGCHAHGDVIELAKQYFEINYPAAIQRVAQDAGISLPTEGKRDYKSSAAITRAQKRREQRTRLEAIKDRVEAQYWEAFDAWLKLDQLVADLAEKEKKTPKEPFSEPFCEALIARQEARQKLEYITVWRDEL